VLEYIDGRKIAWMTVDKQPPSDAPICGFANELCQKPATYTMTIIWSVLAIVGVVSLVVGVFLYRQRKYEEELEGLVWKIDPVDIRPMHDQIGSLDSMLAVSRADMFRPGARNSTGGNPSSQHPNTPGVHIEEASSTSQPGQSSSRRTSDKYGTLEVPSPVKVVHDTSAAVTRYIACDAHRRACVAENVECAAATEYKSAIAGNCTAVEHVHLTHKASRRSFIDVSKQFIETISNKRRKVDVSADVRLDIPSSNSSDESDTDTQRFQQTSTKRSVITNSSKVSVIGQGFGMHHSLVHNLWQPPHWAEVRTRIVCISRIHPLSVHRVCTITKIVR
jgi:hypothetical protein